MPEREIIPIRGLNLADADPPPGACRALSGLVPRPPVREDAAPVWTVRPPGQRLDSFDGYTALGWQTRDQKGDFAGRFTFGADQPLNRLLALNAPNLDAVDPGGEAPTVTLYNRLPLGGADLRADFAQLGSSVFVAVYQQAGGRVRPVQLLEVVDDEARPAQWPMPPLVTGSASASADPESLPPGRYIARVAEVLEDGTVGPTSGPAVIDATGLTSEKGVSIELTAEPDSTPGRLYRDRRSTWRLFLQPPVIDKDGNETRPAETQPAYRVAEVEPDVTGAEPQTVERSMEALREERTYDGIGLQAHDFLPAALTTYNKRLVAGNVAYDLENPPLRRIIDPGLERGSDVHVLLAVDVETPSGTITRFSEPIGLTESAAQSFATRHGLMWYRDARARAWRLWVSTDYTESVNDPFANATWRRPVIADDQVLQSPSASSYASERLTAEPYNLTNYEVSRTGVTGSGEWNGDLESTAYDTEVPSGVPSGGQDGADSPNSAELDLSAVTSKEVASVVVTAEIDEDTGPNKSADASLTVLVREGGSDSSNVLQETSVTEPGITTVTLNSYDKAKAASIEIQTEASASATQPDGDTSVTAYARAVAQEVRIGVSGETPDGQGLTPPRDLDRGPNRLTWTATNRPYARPPGNIAYAGERDSDPILSLEPTGVAVSAGQYGEYPILVFGRESVRSAQVSAEGAFIQGIDVLTSEGAVGPRATARLQGSVAAVLDDGLRLFTPDPQPTPLSRPLVGPGDAFLSGIGPDTILLRHRSPKRDATELWVAAENGTWSYHVQQGVWTNPPYQIRAAASRRTITAAIDTDLSLGGLLRLEASDGPNPREVKVEWAALPLAGPSQIARLRQIRLQSDLHTRGGSDTSSAGLEVEAVLSRAAEATNSGVTQAAEVTTDPTDSGAPPLQIGDARALAPAVIFRMGGAGLDPDAQVEGIDCTYQVRPTRATIRPRQRPPDVQFSAAPPTLEVFYDPV